MSQEECYKYLKRRRGKIKTTSEISRALRINSASAARNLRVLSEQGMIEKIEGHSKYRAGQSGYFWRYNGRTKPKKNE